MIKNITTFVFGLLFSASVLFYDMYDNCSMEYQIYADETYNYDTDGNGSVNVLDAVFLINYILDSESGYAGKPDINHDGFVNVQDYTELWKCLSGCIDTADEKNTSAEDELEFFEDLIRYPDIYDSEDNRRYNTIVTGMPTYYLISDFDNDGHYEMLLLKRNGMFYRNTVLIRADGEFQASCESTGISVYKNGVMERSYFNTVDRPLDERKISSSVYDTRNNNEYTFRFDENGKAVSVTFSGQEYSSDETQKLYNELTSCGIAFTESDFTDITQNDNQYRKYTRKINSVEYFDSDYNPQKFSSYEEYDEYYDTYINAYYEGPCYGVDNARVTTLSGYTELRKKPSDDSTVLKKIISGDRICVGNTTKNGEWQNITYVIRKGTNDQVLMHGFIKNREVDNVKPSH